MNNCSLSPGELYKSGLMLDNGETGPLLMSPNQEAKIPVVFQRISFAIEAVVNRISNAEEEGTKLFVVRASQSNHSSQSFI